MSQDSTTRKTVKVFSAGPEVPYRPFADALKDFKVGALSPSKRRKQRASKKIAPASVSAPTVAKPKEVKPIASPSAHVMHAEVQVSHSSHHVSRETPVGNVSIGQLFMNRDRLLSFLNAIYEKKEKAICTFFQLGTRASGDGKRAKSFLSLRIIVRPGERIALCVVPGGTKWLAERFPVGLEFYLDELLFQREAPEERRVATRVLRLFMDDVRAARYEAKKLKETKVK